MTSKKPPDPDPPDELFDLSPVLTVSLPHATEIPPQDPAMETENANRKRVAGSPPAISNIPPKIAKNLPGRIIYTKMDNPPYIVHVSLKHEQTSGTVLQPIKFGMFLTTNNVSNVRLDGIKRIGRNRVSVEFKSYQDANSFLNNTILTKNSYIASIPQYNITRMGIVRDIPVEWSEDDVIKHIQVPEGCGPVIKARRMSRKVISSGITEWKPTQTVVLTFDGQVLPKRVISFYSSLPVERYTYPTILCYHCCRFGHTRTLCRSKPRCFKCGENHPGDGCEVTKEFSFCVSCTGNHFANDSACPELGRQKSIKALMSEKSISYVEASRVFPPVSRSYAEVSKSSPRNKVNVISQSQSSSPIPTSQKSYRKTVFLKPKTHAPLSPGYNRQVHQELTQNYSFSPSRNGCALPTEGDALTFRQENNSANILQLITDMLMSVLCSPNRSIPDHVASKLTSILNYIHNVPSPDIPTMEHEEYYSQKA
ncbi:hypothetical protein PYW07_006201 [Mythimna separata]|uniref:Gag-like protein n=1 Tax=Mythimna separata TaxID=271217 RepID=A0AAD8DQI7_MYTSE|nr:hypothetical protein PYW07_003350 [Mythimna separata]KAJ8728505.1 hypothetical protein PYW07_006201 [Mythimna separata]